MTASHSPAAQRRLTLADLLTLANAATGAASIALAAATSWGAGGPGRGTLAVAVALLVTGCLLDIADGPAARRLGPSRSGVALDVAADLVAFGVAPAVWLARDTATRGGGWGSVAAVVAAAGFVGAAAFRLFRHARTTERHAGPFKGLPTPAAAATALALLALRPPASLTATGLVVVAALMASAVPCPRPSRRLAPVLAACLAIAVAALLGALPLRPVAAGWLALVAAIPLRSVVARVARPGPASRSV